MAMTHASPCLRKPQPLAAVPSGFLLAKMHGHRATLRARRESWAELARLRSVADLTGRLFPSRAPDDPLGLERRLKSEMLTDLAAFLKFLDRPRARLYAALLSRYLMQNAKALLRRFAPGAADDDDEADALPTLPRPWAQADERMRRAGSAADLLAALPVDVAETDGVPAQEMAIDQAWWREVAAALAALPRGLRTACAAPIALECDTARLLAVQRAAQTYDMPWAELAPLLPAAPGVLTVDTLRSIHADPSHDAVRRAVQLCTGAAPLDPVATASETEDWLWRCTVVRGERLLRHTTDGFAALVGYYYEKRAETRRLRAVSRMIRRARPPAEIEAQLERM
jgi:ATP synthase (C/AC39) subunit